MSRVVFEDISVRAYPCGGKEYVTAQLRVLRAKAIRGATPDELIAEAEREIEAAMEERLR